MAINSIFTIISQVSLLRLPSDDNQNYPREIRDKISRLLVESSFEGKFLPESSLPKVVGDIDFDRLLPGASEALITFVNTRAIRVFLTALLSIIDITEPRLVEVAKSFQEKGFTDKYLPIKDISKRGRCFSPDSYLRCRCKECGHARGRGKADCPHDPALDSFHMMEWNKLSFDTFLCKQWMFIAPVFKKSNFKILKSNLPNQTVLPFIWKDPRPFIGHFSNVFHAKLHVAHQDGYELDDTDGFHVALKRLRPLLTKETGYNAEISWQSEVDALTEIRGLKDGHLIYPIAAFKWRMDHYIMLEWANGGTLRNLWDRANEGNDHLTKQRIKEFLSQICGLAGALSKLHGTNQQTATALAEAEIKRSALPNSDLRPPRSKQQADTSVNLQSPNFQSNGGPSYTDDMPVITFSDADRDSDAKHWRHGDIKPENILIFKDSTWLGTLKIADLGLAKQHQFATEFRHQATSTKHSTLHYQAPEAVTNTKEPRSRRYDVWSMGCIILEFIIWFLYGSEGLRKFYEESMRLKDHTQQTLYFTTSRSYHNNGDYELVASVSNIATHWIREMLEKDPECKGYTALRQLLELVQDRLLVVPVPNRLQPRKGSYRATSGELYREVENIRRTAEEDDEYLFTGTDRRHVQMPSLLSAYDGIVHQVGSVRDQDHLGVGMPLTRGSTHRALLDNLWEFFDDETISSHIFKSSGFNIPHTFPNSPTATCERCRALDVGSPGLITGERSRYLDLTKKSCALCELLFSKFGTGTADIAEIWRVGGGLARHSEGAPTLSLYRKPSENTGSDTQVRDIPIGFPKLTSFSSETYFEILRKWLKDCDENHPRCHIESTEASFLRMPTRLIDVGGEGSPKVHLLETKDSQQGPVRHYKYIALSHPWGTKAEHNHYCTTRQNIHHHKAGISPDVLPDTFKDAIRVTRELGVKYLWIDSLCIVQGEDGDFDEEAIHMETVFSMAYCVIAATRAKGASSGFLNARPERKVVGLERPGEPPLYICECIDDFQKDVIDGPLNKRGWVFQERALARRTIYFAENQNYWECGEGVRCETMARMKNNQAALLGDPRFPKVATDSSKGGRIRLYEHLYEQYSRLQFTRICDRPLAIAGLEQRLIRAFDTQGGYGVFTRYFGRGLLWQRDTGSSQAMQPIDFPKSQAYNVPSWSWMAYEGAITFMDLPFGEIDWEERELQSPWSTHGPVSDSSASLTSSSNATWHTTKTKERIDLTVIVRDFRASTDTHIVYDRGDRPKDQVVKCVVVGKRKEKAQGNGRQICYVLVVAQKKDAGHDTWYERIGVGYLPRNSITLEGTGSPAQVF
ncbi:heterokaryon incompatibility protein-domain-containing protein [Xylaria venustula]|nr:heterokaryon incompatibility protein-domain-containing protein [Xylaria venustula]